MSYYRRNPYDITPLMGDILVILYGSSHPMTAQEIRSHMEVGSNPHIGKPLAGLHLRGLIKEGYPKWRRTGQTVTKSRTWAIRQEGISDALWGRVMVDHARRHNYPISSVMTQEDMERCEIRVPA